jgi:hypothetical protein
METNFIKRRKPVGNSWRMELTLNFEKMKKGDWVVA